MVVHKHQILSLCKLINYIKAKRCCLGRQAYEKPHVTDNSTGLSQIMFQLDAPYHLNMDN